MTPFRASAPLTQDWKHFDFAVADGVARITLNRPEKLNPLTFESYADLRDLFARTAAARRHSRGHHHRRGSWLLLRRRRRRDHRGAA